MFQSARRMARELRRQHGEQAQTSDRASPRAALRSNRTVPASSPHSTSVTVAWLVVILLMPVALLNYLDRQMLAAMQSSVMSDIPSIGTDENWGFMLGQFKWVYAFLSPLGGYLADRFSRRFTICASLFVWSAVTWWTGHVASFDELLMARSLMGISEAFYMPAALALIADYHTGGTRSRAIGLHQMAIYCGVIVGGFGGYVADAPALGWRSAFDGCGLFGMLYAVPLVLLLRDAPTAGTDPAAAHKPEAPARALACAAGCGGTHTHSQAELMERLATLRRFARPGICSTICRSSSSCSISRSRRWRGGSCATGCRPFSSSNSTSIRVRPAFPRRSTGRPPRLSARWAAAGGPTAGCNVTRA